MKKFMVVVASPVHPEDSNPQNYNRCLIRDNSNNKIYSVGGNNGTSFDTEKEALDFELEYLRSGFNRPDNTKVVENDN